MKFLGINLSDPLHAFQKELRKYGYSKCSIPTPLLHRYFGIHNIAITDGKFLFIISDLWHDQQIMIELVDINDGEIELLDIRKLLEKYKLYSKYDFVNIASYSHQSVDSLIGKQILFIENIIALLS